MESIIHDHVTGEQRGLNPLHCFPFAKVQPTRTVLLKYLTGKTSSPSLSKSTSQWNPKPQIAVLRLAENKSHGWHNGAGHNGCD